MFFNYKDLSTSQFKSIVDEIKESELKQNDYLASLTNENISYNTFFQSSIDEESLNLNKSTILNMKSFHPNKEIRDICNELSGEYQKFMIEQSMRKDVFEVFNKYYNNVYPNEKNNLTDEQNKYVEKCKLNYDMMGLSLNNDAYQQFKNHKTKITENSKLYSQNLAEENSTYKFHKDKLQSMPEYWLNGKVKDNEGYITVTLKYPDYLPIMEYCSDREIRKEMSYHFGRRCINENIPLLQENLMLRKKMAELYNMNYSDYKLQDRMAKNSHNVMSFLNLVKNKIKPQLNLDLEALEKIAGHKLETYDISYYSRIYKEQELELKMNDLKELFETNTVIKGTMDIYQQLLGLKFVEITDQVKNILWHESVRTFEVYDNNNNVFKLIGSFMLDLYPREGKYGHAAVFPFNRRHFSNKLQILPFAVMACNFNDSGTLEFGEVETFFHEFGHVMHNICTKATIGSLAGTSVERDFVETPSQFFENWCYYYESLKYLAPNITLDICKKLLKMKKMLNGYHFSRQLVFASVDMYLHTNYNNEDLFSVYANMYKDITTLNVLENTNMLASFGHIMGGYDAGYYGYMWSLVYSELLLSSFKKTHNMMNTELGEKLKKYILAPGGTQDSSKSMEQYLGRPLNFELDIEEFIKSIV
jgi:thimet oligopeptidase